MANFVLRIAAAVGLTVGLFLIAALAAQGCIHVDKIVMFEPGAVQVASRPADEGGR